MRASTVILGLIAAVAAAGVGLASYQLFLKQQANKPGALQANSRPASNTATGTTPPARSQPAAAPSTSNFLSVADIKANKKPVRPAFSLPDLDDKPRKISEFDGKIIILNFWASWCPPCVKEMPAFVRIQDKYKKQGVQVVGVAIDQKQLAMDFADRFSINYPIMYGGINAAEIGKQYGNHRGQLPYTVFIDREKKLVAVKQGEITEAQMEAFLKPLLQATKTAEK
jgi:thiol-disulfide isomerase/thioredoxin